MHLERGETKNIVTTTLESRNSFTSPSGLALDSRELHLYLVDTATRFVYKFNILDSKVEAISFSGK